MWWKREKERQNERWRERLRMREGAKEREYQGEQQRARKGHREKGTETRRIDLAERVREKENKREEFFQPIVGITVCMHHVCNCHCSFAKFRQ